MSQSESERNQWPDMDMVMSGKIKDVHTWRVSSYMIKDSIEKFFDANSIQLVPKLGQLSLLQIIMDKGEDKILRLMTILKWNEVYIQVLLKGVI